MQQHQSLSFWAPLFCLFTSLIIVIPEGFAQIDQVPQPTPVAASGPDSVEHSRAELTATKQDVADSDESRQPDPIADPEKTAQVPAVDKRDEAVLPQSTDADESQAEQVQVDQPNITANDLFATPDPQEGKATLEILGKSIAPGESDRLLWVAGETSYGSKLETPVYVIRGKHAGPTLCLTAAIHGDELNGVEIIRSLVSDLSPKKLYGTVIGVPIVNLLGFTRGTRYLPDRRDLNRYFPGNPNGSSASRIAFSFFKNIVRHCDLLIDLHTGSLSRTNMPQVRANLQLPEVLEFTTKFGSTAVLHSGKLRGNLRSAATNYGIPAVALELGEPGSLQKEHVEEGVDIIENVLSGLNMTHRLWTVGESQPVFYSSRWVRVNTGGLLISKVEVGERIWEGAVLGSMVNPITNESFEVVSPYSGRVLGMALNQFMLPGYAAFNIGIVADKKAVVDDAQALDCIMTEMDPSQATDNFGCVTEEDEESENEEIDRSESDDGDGS